MSAGRIVAAVAAVLLVALVTTRRRRLGLERTAVAVVAALALGVYAAGVLSAVPDPEKAIEDLAHTLGTWTYVLVGGMSFLETGAFIGFLAPGEFTVIVGGVIAGEGEIDVMLLIGITWVAALCGDSVSFGIGRKFGRGFLIEHGPRLRITKDRLAQVERYLDRHGGKTIVIGRFLGFVRPLAPFIAGSSRMRYARFLPYSIVGTGLWGATFCLLGFFFYRSFDQVTAIAGRASVAFAVLVGAIVGGIYAYRRLRHEEERRRLGRWFERQGRRPLLRPLAAVLRPMWRRVVRPAWRLAAPRLRFMWRRLTPGRLGIEFTTAVAVAVAGLYVFVLFTSSLADDPRATASDREVLEILNDLRDPRAVDVAKVVTVLGSAPITGGLVALGALLLVLRRRPAELFALVGGFAAIFAAVHLTKAGIDRPRPSGPLVTIEGSSFPSGHAAYSATYVAFAFIAARVLPGIVSRASLVLASLIAAAVIGLTRIYLHAHYWSDVAGGWALGAGLLATAGAIALLVAHIRQNVRRSPPRRAAPAPAQRG